MKQALGELYELDQRMFMVFVTGLFASTTVMFAQFYILLG